MLYVLAWHSFGYARGYAYWLDYLMKPIEITRYTARTCIEIAGVCSGANITADVQRVGGSKKITYPAISVGDGAVCFAWDDELVNGEAGRYQFKINGLAREACLFLELIDDFVISGATNIEFNCKGC